MEDPIGMESTPSVLDYVKSRLMPWKYPHVEITPVSSTEDEAGGSAPPVKAIADTTTAAFSQAHPINTAIPAPTAHAAQPEEQMAVESWRWLALAGLVLALAGQFALGPRPDRSWQAGTLLLIIGMAVTAFVWLRSSHYISFPAALLPPNEPAIDIEIPKATIRPISLGIGAGLAILAFFLFIAFPVAGEPRFNYLNLMVTLAAAGFTIDAFWQRRQGIKATSTTASSTADISSQPVKSNRAFNLWGLLASVMVIGLVLFFRLYRLADTPPEMNSDHAEKILDILKVLNAEYHIFFAGNGGREALIFYLGAALIRLTGMAPGFLSLKLVSVAIGLAAQPLIYLVGKEIGGRRIGVLAFVLSGVAYWPNVVARFGLRLPFYILFTAAAMYFVLHGLRTTRRNDFVYAGIVVGLGMYGYTPDRLLPLTIIAAFLLYILHRRTAPQARFATVGVLAVGLVAFMLFVPLLSYIVSQPDAFLFRTITRMAGAERPLEDSAALIFIRNVGRALGMFSWDNGEIWPISIPHYPALSMVSGALFYLGVVIALVRYIRQRHWQDLFLILSIPLLQIPSSLALAFPAENPNLYRTGGALIPVFVLAALALDALMQQIQGALHGKAGSIAAWVLALLLIATNSWQDYTWTFNRYNAQYRLSAQNSSEMGKVVKDFIYATNSPDTVWVMAYPHWVDSRLVAINAGYPGRDYRIDPPQIADTVKDQRPKLFLVHPKDEAGIAALEDAYPQGWFETYPAILPEKNFLVFFTTR